ncbi:DUF6597 domain-containing transcriptional factor [Empedobacter tilapiae]
MLIKILTKLAYLKKYHFKLDIIRKYYQPIQPTISKIDGEIIYQEIQPTKKIENMIYCFWNLKTKKKLKKNYLYRVVSDGCIDIFFDNNNPTENYIMGFCKKYTEFQIGKDFNYIGIRFLPSAFPLIFDINAKLLSNNSQELKFILPEFSNWISTEFKTKKTFEEITKLLNEKLIIEFNQQKKEIDTRFLKSLELIFQNKGFLDTENDLNIGLSSRQLRRIFDYYIGTSVKSFSNVVRFQHILNSKPSKESLKNSKLYFDVGFYDQAHFINNFKAFYGVTPSEAFS